jgi:hypothetical protein
LPASAREAVVHALEAGAAEAAWWLRDVGLLDERRCREFIRAATDPALDPERVEATLQGMVGPGVQAWREYLRCWLLATAASRRALEDPEWLTTAVDALAMASDVLAWVGRGIRVPVSAGG